MGDTDSPVLRGIDNALLAFAEGDMYERSRQFAKSQVKFTEAAAHIQIMKDLEKGQQQSITRIVPYINDEYSVSDIF
jgi:tRNA A37 N6-isopentenylltransferase MiaA